MSSMDTTGLEDIKWKQVGFPLKMKVLEKTSKWNSSRQRKGGNKKTIEEIKTSNKWKCFLPLAMLLAQRDGWMNKKMYLDLCLFSIFWPQFSKCKYKGDKTLSSPFLLPRDIVSTVPASKELWSLYIFMKKPLTGQHEQNQVLDCTQF